jgi:hypothetical protein
MEQVPIAMKKKSKKHGPLGVSQKLDIAYRGIITNEY